MDQQRTNSPQLEPKASSAMPTASLAAEPLPPVAPAAPAAVPPVDDQGKDNGQSPIKRKLVWWPSVALVAVAVLGAVLLQVAPIKAYVQRVLPRPEVSDILPPARVAERGVAWDGGQPPLETAPVPGRPDLIQVTVWDDLVEDGDTLTLSSGGVAVPVHLTKAGAVVFLPRPADGVVRLSANVDGGGGGITLGVLGSGSPRYSPILAPGQTTTLHV